ncbi:hypothetical protein QYE76_064411 [Lolium multiflorum]|uniref:Retrotransposon gag domain-containing protein n=1 Tax=Lolium multiflorum TaxID=4521 RepID=A0AAD8W7L5_LOLMU|nr:hypothetical protein QYE76_064411 [Lolium multiflorum]
MSCHRRDGRAGAHGFSGEVDILNKPITPEEAADPEALEARRQEMLATAQKFAKTAAAMLEERTLAANFVDYSLKKDREVDEMMATAKDSERSGRKEQQPLATPKDNMKKAAEMKKKDEEIDINYVRKLVASQCSNRARQTLRADLPRHHPVEAEVEAERRPEISFPLKITRWCPRDARDRLNEYRSDYIGPRCFGQMIREEPKPRSLNLKLPGNLKHYDGSERPDTWIEDYYNAVTFAGGTPNIACRMLQLYLIGPARVWLSDLEENTIFCWLDLKKAFENHFRGTYKRPATTSDLQACIQKKGETSRSFLTRWLATRNECET